MKVAQGSGLNATTAVTRQVTASSSQNICTQVYFPITENNNWAHYEYGSWPMSLWTQYPFLIYDMPCVSQYTPAATASCNSDEIMTSCSGIASGTRSCSGANAVVLCVK